MKGKELVLWYLSRLWEIPLNSLFISGSLIASKATMNHCSEICQNIGQALQIRWKLHAYWRSQSMGKTEKRNHIIKKTLAKICQKTCKITFQVSLLGIPPLDLGYEWEIKQYIQHLGQTLTPLYKFANCRSIYSSHESLHPFHQGNQVLLKTRNKDTEQQLAKQWTSPYGVLLTAQSSLKVITFKPLFHHTRNLS